MKKVFVSCRISLRLMSKPLQTEKQEETPAITLSPVQTDSK